MDLDLKIACRPGTVIVSPVRFKLMLSCNNLDPPASNDLEGAIGANSFAEGFRELQLEPAALTADTGGGRYRAWAGLGLGPRSVLLLLIESRSFNLVKLFSRWYFPSTLL